MNDVIVSGSSLFQNAGFPAVGEDFTVSGVVTLSDTSSVLESTLGSSTGSISRDPLDLSKEVSFFIMPPGFDEELFLHSLEVRIVPEPRVVVLLALATIGFLRRWR